VGTKRQAQEAVAEEAKRCGAFFVNHRWLGGTLTNWATLQKSIKRLKLLKAMNEDGRIKELSKKEQARLDREMKHLFQNLEGIENMTQLPDAMFVIDSNAEEIAVKEARRMGVPVVSVVDTNCDPDVVDWIIPATMTRCAPSACSRRRLRIPSLKATPPTSSRRWRSRRPRKTRRWWTASSTSTRAHTNSTRNRKATSLRALWKPRGACRGLRKPLFLPTTRNTKHIARVGNL